MRRGQRSDIDACARIVVADPLWRRYGLTLPQARRVLRQAMGRQEGRGRNRTELAVATLGGLVVGFVLYQRYGTFHYSGYVRWIAVAPQAQGRGVGRALMHHAEAQIFRTGPNVFLTVSDFNRRAQAFYRTLGYKNVGAIPNYVVPGITERLYRKTRGPIKLRAR
jgi:ribosomal-protein-alanine N-acetyltransferase